MRMCRIRFIRVKHQTGYNYTNVCCCTSTFVTENTYIFRPVTRNTVMCFFSFIKTWKNERPSSFQTNVDSSKINIKLRRIL